MKAHSQARLVPFGSSLNGLLMRGGDCDIAIEVSNKSPSEVRNDNRRFDNSGPTKEAESLDNSCLLQFFKILKKIQYTDRSTPPLMVKYAF